MSGSEPGVRLELVKNAMNLDDNGTTRHDFARWSRFWGSRVLKRHFRSAFDKCAKTHGKTYISVRNRDPGGVNVTRASRKARHGPRTGPGRTAGQGASIGGGPGGRGGQFW